MESLNIKTYLLYAIYIVRTNPVILLFITILSLIHGIGTYLPDTTIARISLGLNFIELFFISPLIYGTYFEIIEDNFSTVGKIVATYVPGYLLLIICMYIPLLTALSSIMGSPNAEYNLAYVMLVIVFFSILYIYVIPTYFTSRIVVGSLFGGIKFLIENLVSSVPVLSIALFSELLLLISQYKMTWLKEMNLFLFSAMQFSVYLISHIIDIILFIMLVYILKNHSESSDQQSGETP